MWIFIFTYLYFHKNLQIFQKILQSQELFFENIIKFSPPNISPQQFWVTFYNEKNQKIEYSQNKELNIFTDSHIWKIQEIKNQNYVINPSIDDIWELIKDERFMWWYKYNFALYAQNFATFFRDEYVIGSWIDRNEKLAKIKAIAEWFERYSSGWLKSDKYIELSKDKINEQLFNDIYLGASQISDKKTIYTCVWSGEYKRMRNCFWKNSHFSSKIISIVSAW